MNKPKKLFLVCDYNDNPKFDSCGGRLLEENGKELVKYHSSNIQSLKSDLLNNFINHCVNYDDDKYEIINLLNVPCPKKFKQS